MKRLNIGPDEVPTLNSTTKEVAEKHVIVLDWNPDMPPAGS